MNTFLQHLRSYNSLLQFWRDAPSLLLIIWIVIGAFLLIFIVLILYVTIHRMRSDYLANRNKQLRRIYERLLSTTLYDDESRETFIQKSFVQKNIHKKIHRSILMEQLLMLKKNLSGRLEEDVEWLYNELGLKADSYAKIESDKWHIIAKGIREISIMEDASSVDHLNKFINHRVRIVRREARLALIRILGKDGLPYISEVKVPLSDWQQMAILFELENSDNNAEPDVAIFLNSKEESKINFACKIIVAFNLSGYDDDLMRHLEHESEIVRIEIVKTLASLSKGDVKDHLMEIFPIETIRVKRQILETFGFLGTEIDIPFLQEQLVQDDFQISLNSALAIKNIADDPRDVFKQMMDHLPEHIRPITEHALDDRI